MLFFALTQGERTAMKEMNNQTTPNPLTVSREVQIGKTIYAVNSVFNGQCTLEEILREWVVKKALATSNS